MAQPRGRGAQKVTFAASRDFKNQASLLAAPRDLQGGLGTGRWWQQRWHLGWHVLGQGRGSPPVPHPALSLCSHRASQRAEEQTHCWMDASWGQRAGDVLPPLTASRHTPARGARDAFWAPSPAKPGGRAGLGRKPGLSSNSLALSCGCSGPVQPSCSCTATSTTSPQTQPPSPSPASPHGCAQMLLNLPWASQG